MGKLRNIRNVEVSSMKAYESGSQQVKYLCFPYVAPVRGYEKCEKRDRKTPKIYVYIIKLTQNHSKD